MEDGGKEKRGGKKGGRERCSSGGDEMRNTCNTFYSKVTLV